MPLTIRLGVWGASTRRKLLQRGPGRSPAENGFYAFEVRKKPPGTPFSVFLSDGGAPKRCGARENFPPFPPLDGPVSVDGPDQQQQQCLTCE